MNHDPADAQRRSMLLAAAGLAAFGGAAQPAGAAPAKPPAPTGRPRDFAFLSGEWKIDNRQLRDGAWQQFEGEATLYGILPGGGSVEELRIPARNFSGMGLRLLDVERKL